MTYEDKNYKIPNNDSCLWRYLDFAKFVSMLQKKALYFSKLSAFKDPFEGAIGILDNKNHFDKSEILLLLFVLLGKPNASNEVSPPSNEVFREAQRIIADVEQNKASNEDLETYNLAVLGSSRMSHIRPQKREFTFVNCWYESLYESDAMWTLYSKDTSNAVAIKTTYEKLHLSLGNNSAIQIGRLNYIDYNKQVKAINSPHWYKMQNFSNENEVRAVLIDPSEQNIDGKEIAVDLDILIDKIYVSPYCSTWFVNVIKDIIFKYGVNKEIHYSELSIKPLY